MNIANKLFDPKIGRKITILSYLKQSLMAGIFLWGFLFAWNQIIPINNQILFSAIASSTFLTFISTNIYQSLSSKIIGGQVIGVMVGIFLWYGKMAIIVFFVGYDNQILMIFIGISVALSVLLMAILDFEHPPAAGTAMAFVFQPTTPVISDAALVIIAAILLGIIHFYLKKRHMLKNLN